MVGQLAPQGVDGEALRFGHAEDRQIIADEDGTINLSGQIINADAVKQLTHARQLLRGDASGSVVDRQKRMGLTATEGSHEIDDRFPATASEALDRLLKQVTETPG